MQIQVSQTVLKSIMLLEKEKRSGVHGSSSYIINKEKYFVKDQQSWETTQRLMKITTLYHSFGLQGYWFKTEALPSKLWHDGSGDSRENEIFNKGEQQETLQMNVTKTPQLMHLRLWDFVFPGFQTGWDLNLSCFFFFFFFLEIEAQRGLERQLEENSYSPIR